ncbi:sensor domain-containing protein [Sessilibacter sp. MAH4]
MESPNKSGLASYDNSRVIGLGVLLFLIVVIVSAMYQVNRTFSQEREEWFDTFNQTLPLIESLIINRLILSEEGASQFQVSEISYNSNIHSLTITDALNRPVYEYISISDEHNAFIWFTQLLGDQYVLYKRDLLYTDSDINAEYLGNLSIEIDQNSVYTPLYKAAITDFIVQVLLDCLLLLLLVYFYYVYYSKPARKLADELHSLSLNDAQNHRIASFDNRQDSFGDLANSANHLLSELASVIKSEGHLKDRLAHHQLHLRQLIDCLPVYLCVRNANGQILYANSAWSATFGLSVDEVCNKKFSEVVDKDAEKLLGVAQHDRTVLEEGRSIFVAEECWVDSFGNPQVWQSHYVKLRYENQPVVLVVSSDISDRKKKDADIEFMSYHDPLTTLPNRIQLVDRLENEIHRAARHHYFGAVLFIDLDQFKNINDSLGHPVGDIVLQEVSRRLSACVREGDVVSRLGGDEFVAVLTVLDTGFASAEKKAVKIGENIRAQISQPIFHKDLELRITASVGAVIFPDGNVSVHELLSYADTAMFQVKETGRDGIALFNETMAEYSRKLILLETQLHKALALEQFELFFQPKVDVMTGFLTGAEALLRWKHPELGYRSPGEFISILESSGLIVQVGKWILEEACRNLQSWQAASLWFPEMRLSVNISPRQFRHPSFVEDVKSILQHIPIQPKTLDIEVTESVVIGNVDDTVETMNMLGKEGISFSLDDFGTGYSSISYLKRLPVSTLKIDQSFVRDISVDRSDKVLVQSMANMGKLLGLKVVAEGVEENDQLDIIREFGCDEYQGYFFSRPIPCVDFIELLKRHRQMRGANGSRPATSG